MVKISHCLNDAVLMLTGKVQSPRLEAEILLSHLLQKDRLYLSIHKNDSIDDDVAGQLNVMCLRRIKNEPIAYITGVKEFMSLEFMVNPGVLIPRPETEMLAEYIISSYSRTAVSIIDICTGSGAIACSLAKYMPKASVTAIDISPDALATASENALRLGVADRVRFVQADALKAIDLGQRFDIAVSNPPYIESATVDILEKDVREYEPRLALDGGKDGLIFYRKIVDNIESTLNIGGELIFETGYNQGPAIKEIMSKKFACVKVSQDFAGLDRMICGQLE